MKVLLVADVPPCASFTGALLTEALCRFLPRGALACFTTPVPELAEVPISPDLSEVPLESATISHDHTLGFLGGRVRSLTWARGMHHRLFHLPALVRRIVRFGREQRVDRVWVILQSQASIRVARPVAEALGVPLLCQIWDYPEYWIEVNRLDRVSSRSLLRAFGETIRSSACVAAASPEMVDDIDRRWGTAAVPVVGSLDRSLARRPEPMRHSDDDEWVIGMAGQLYATGAWAALLEALCRCRWRIHGRPVRVRYLGYNDPFAGAVGRTVTRRHEPICIEHLGYRPQGELIEILTDCDLLYVPYSAGPAFDRIALTSFPAKIATYLATGRPVFFHGPDATPPSRFVRETGAGVTCDSLDPDVIGRTLEEFLGDRERVEAATRAAQQAFEEHLTLDTLRERFQEFIECTGEGDRCESSRSATTRSSGAASTASS